jgi:hypothetical protein
MDFSKERFMQDKAFQESLKNDAAKKEEKELQDALAAIEALEKAKAHLSVAELRAARLDFYKKA